MTCQTCRARLPEHLEAEELSVVRHLRQCPACRAELAALVRALALLETDPAPIAPELRLGLWTRIEAAERETARTTWERPVALGLAVALLGCLGSLLLANWPAMVGWTHVWQGWPAVGELGTGAMEALSAAMVELPNVGLSSWEQVAARRHLGLVGSLPGTVGLAIVAAAGALACEWTARRDLARLAMEPEGVR